MRMNWKRLLAFLLCLLMLGTAFPAFTAAAEDLELIPIIDESDEFDPDDEIAVIDEDLLTPPEDQLDPLGSKPTITTQPSSVTKSAGETAKFTVKASGATKYQWYYRKTSDGEWKKSGMSSATSATLSITATEARNGFQFCCRVANSYGHVYTKAVTLTVASKPVVTTQPKNVTMTKGYTAKFTVKASGATKYQWYYRKTSSSEWNKSTMDSATSATLSVTATDARNGFQFRCRVSSSGGYVYTNAVTLTVTNKPVITSQPKSATATQGGGVDFKVKAVGATSYQWYYRKTSDGEWKKSTMSSATSATLTTTATMARNGFQYRCRLYNSSTGGYRYTNVVTLTVVEVPPFITTQPKNVTITEGQTASFTVGAEYADSYQWYWWKEKTSEWVKVASAPSTSATLTFTDVDYNWNGYLFCCLVSNGAGGTWTDNVMLTVSGRIAPTIKANPKSVSITEGQSATFSVTARHAASYQWYWYKASTNEWVKVASVPSTSSTLQFTDVPLSWNGYKFFCKVTNSAGSISSTYATLTIANRATPVITTQPKNVTVETGTRATFTLSAKYADAYTWYWRENSSSSWNEISSVNSRTIYYDNVSAGWNGYQFRCKVSNSEHYAYSNTVTLTVTPRYRALLVGEVNFNSGEVATRNRGDVTNLTAMFNEVQGPTGGSYTVTTAFDLDKAGLTQAITDAFSGADENDVSFFFIATHGATGYSSGEKAGQLSLIGKTQAEYMTIQELADCLKAVPGKVIVVLGSCGSGAAIVENGAPLTEEQIDANEIAFNDAVISAFEEADRQFAAENGWVVANTGELRDSKFYVLTAARHREMSWGFEYDGGSPDGYNHFPYYIYYGAIGSKPADADGNGTITLNEMYNYVYTHALGPYYQEHDPTAYYQHAQVYPENSSYALFK